MLPARARAIDSPRQFRQGFLMRGWYIQGMKNMLPIAVSILLLLPLLYVGSYVAMVTPNRVATSRHPFRRNYQTNYRFGDRWARPIYWPLERIAAAIPETMEQLPILLLTKGVIQRTAGRWTSVT
jgi:hypothetical protein